jgi:hypothetical protein
MSSLTLELELGDVLSFLQPIKSLLILPASRCGLLQGVHDIGDGGENLIGRFGLVGFGVDAEQGFGAGGTDHDPADVAEIEFDAVHIFAIGDVEIEELFEFCAGEVVDGFFFLTGLEVEIDAAVMIFAKFLVESGQEFAERFVVPSHEFGEEERGDGGVALGEIHAGADAAAFFAADQNILLEHELADVFETNGDFVEFTRVFCGEFVDKFCDGESFGDFAFELAGADEVPNEERENLMGIDEGAVAIDGADAVAVAVSGEADVVFAGEDGFAERIDVRLDGFGVGAAEKRIARAADFVAGDAVALENFGEDAGGGAMHGVGDITKFRFAETIPIDEFFDGFDVRGARVEFLDEIFLRGQRRDAFFDDAGEFGFDLRDDRGECAAAVAGFVLDAVPAGGIVAGSDDEAAGGFALADEQRDRGSGAGLVGEPDGSAGGADRLRDGCCDCVGAETVVVADEDAFSRVFTANDVTRDGVRDDARVCVGEIVGDDAAPTVGAKFNRSHKLLVYATKVGSPRVASSDFYKSFPSFASSSFLTILPTSCARSRGQMRSASAVSTTTKSLIPIAATNFFGL